MLDTASTADILAACRADVHAAGGVGELAAVLAVHGFARFDGLPDERALLGLAGRLGTVVAHRDSDQTGITVIANRAGGAAGPGRAGFTDHALMPHTDGSDRQRPPHLVMLACARPGRGGQCVVVDARRCTPNWRPHRPWCPCRDPDRQGHHSHPPIAGVDMGHESGQPPAKPGERVITTEAELRAALAETFLGNADAGDHAANDELIAALRAWRRRSP